MADNRPATDLETAVQGVTSRQDPMNRAASYYEGSEPEVFASVRLRRALERTGTSFRVNYARTPVNAVLERLELAAVTATMKDEVVLDETENLVDTTGELDDINQMLTEIWEDNELGIESNEIHRAALVYGECYVMVWPSDADDAEVGDDDTDTFVDIDITLNSPVNTQLFYDPENPRRKLFAAKMWRLNDELNRTRVNLYYPDRVEKWISKAKGAKKQADFVEYIDMYENDFDGEEPSPVWPMPNPFGEVPVFHFRTQRPHGRPEHRDAFGPQDMINKLVVNQMSASDFSAFPQRYVLAGNTASNEASDFDQELDPVNLEENRARLTASPGELWWLQGDDLKIGQLDSSDPKAFLDPLREYVKGMASVTATPLHYFQGMGGVPSGESLRAAEAPLIKKVRDRQQSFGNTWKEVFRFALKITGVTGVSVDVRWASPQSLDDKDAWEAAAAKHAAGVPLKQILMEMGYSEAQADLWTANIPDDLAVVPTRTEGTTVRG